MSTPLPPELAALERALEETRAPLPESLRARILSAPRRMPLAWFAAAAAVAAAVLLNFASSAALMGVEPESPPDPCALSRALYEPCTEKR